ncbi:MAG: MotA/TolQ/ExbB proton channel family protein [Chromatiales bacterium]
MRTLAMVVTLLFSGPAAQAAEPQTLDQLLDSVLKGQSEIKQRNAEREQRFLSERDNQAALLAEARTKLVAEEARAEELKTTYAVNEQALAAQRDALRGAAGELGEFHGVVRQIASDLKGTLESSLVTAQIPGRLQLVDKLAQSEDLPTIDEVEQLWRTVLQETIESGKIVRFPAEIISARGEEEEHVVTRIGVFSAASDGHFLRYAPEIDRLVEPPRQPALIYQRMVKRLEQATQGMTTVAFDPTRGSMLAILAQEPTLWERIQQGRLIGFLTLGLGGVAAIIALWKYYSLTVVKRRVSRQLREREAHTDNPLGRVLNVYTENRNFDVETLELKLDEAVLREVPPIQRGLGALVVIAEAAPLLGLLGTVSGMVATFQALSLFGAGDAKVVAGGISEALVATIIGLCVAIPSLIAHSFLKGQSDYLVQVLDEQASGMVAQMAEAHHRQREFQAHSSPRVVKN